jgi:type IV pilus assembly protein PilW
VKKHQTGLTMIELMIAIALSVLVINGALALLLANRSTSNTTAAVSAVADSGRVAMNFISESVRSGGYMDCGGPNENKGGLASYSIYNLLAPGATGIQQNYAFAFAGFEAVNTNPGAAISLPATVVSLSAPVVADANAGDWSGVGLDPLLLGTAAAPVTGAVSPGVVKGSDVLVVRESQPQVNPVYTSAIYNPVSTTVSLFSVTGVQAGEFAAVSNCGATTIFQIGAVSTIANTLTTTGAQTLNGGNLNQQFAIGTPITPVNMFAYFVGPGRDGDSSLWVYNELQGSFYELVPDIENMQVLYGLASTSPDQVTQYVTAQNVPNFNSVVSVRVALLAASPVGVAALPVPTVATTQSFPIADATVVVPQDGRLRKIYDTTIGVRSAVL